MFLILVRHGESVNNRLRLDTGRVDGRVPDPGLTPTGWRQIEALAAALDDYPRATHLYASLMLRALETAVPLAEAWDLPIVARADSHECGGPYQGARLRVPHPGSGRETLQAVSPRIQLPEQAGENGWHEELYEPESEVSVRARLLVTELCESHSTDAVVAMITHGCFGSFLHETLTGGEPLYLANGATSMYEITEGRTEPVWLNRCDHLADVI